MQNKILKEHLKYYHEATFVLNEITVHAVLLSNTILKNNIKYMQKWYMILSLEQYECQKHVLNQVVQMLYVVIYS